MEAFAFAASITGTIQLAGKVTALGYGYIGSVLRASGDVRKLMTEIELLKQALIKLNECIDSGHEIITIYQVIQDCRLELEGLASRLKSTTGVRGTLKKVLWKLEWPFKEGETLQILNQIERHKSTLLIALGNHQVSLLNSIYKDVEQVAPSLRVLQNQFQMECAEQGTFCIDEKKKAILEWLYSGDVNTKHVEISSRRQENTGQWLLRSPGCRSWIEGKAVSNLLWGYGIAGAGKTFLSSLVIEHLQENQAQRSTKNGVAYFYFDYKEQDNQRPEHVLASLIKQLSCQLPILPLGLEGLYTKLKHSNRRPAVSNLFGILSSIFTEFCGVFLVFDALDECHPERQRKELLPLFHQMGVDGAKLFLTSRQYPEDIQQSLRHVGKIVLSAQSEDIMNYSQRKIRESPRAKRLIEQAGCEQDIISELIGCANGIFLLVAFHVEYLCHQTTLNQLKSALKILKESALLQNPLDPIYDRVISTLRQKPQCCSDLAFQVFAWLIKAKRTLTTQEVQIALAVKPGHIELERLDLPDIETILDVCGGLVIVDDSSATIRLAHFTVQEYLIRKLIIPKETDTALARACITYLSFYTFSNGPCKSSFALETRLRDNPFLEYTAANLSHHLNDCEEHLLKNNILQFLTFPGNTSSWMQVLMYLINRKNVPDEYYNNPQGNRILLQIASAIGNVLVVKHLIQEGADVSEQEDISGYTALHRAAIQGHPEVIRVLLDYGAEISATNRRGWTALHLAARNGHLQVCQVLIGNKCKIEAQNNRGFTALHVAAGQGHEAAARLLLESKAKIEAQDSCGRTALHHAASRGQEATVRLLLDNNAKVETQDHYGLTVSQIAADKRHHGVCQFIEQNSNSIK